MSSKFRLILIWLILLSLPAAAISADVFIPEELQGWQGWVLHDQEHRGCPFYFNAQGAERTDYVCAWPGLLEVSVGAEAGRFSQEWTVYATEAWIPLPGDASYWPHRVTANDRAATVVERRGVPSVRLGPGSYTVSGSFEWDERPGVLRVPDASGLIALSINGDRIARPERDGSGLFLGERRKETQARDAVSAEVYRLVADLVPTRLTTVIRIDVAGGVREELFGPALPAGFTPVSIQSQLPARLEPDGNLRVQVRPGRWQLTLVARADDVVNEISLPQPILNLPKEEVWSYQAYDGIRVTAVEGLPPVDPQQARVPDNWHQQPAYRINPGERFRVEERSRGVVATENELALLRTMWLDFNGAGFVVQDQVKGRMRSDWRLDMSPPYSVLSATEAGEALLITNAAQEGKTGVELRYSDVQLESLGRSDTRAAMPVTGWDSRFASVSTRLHLPPGHKLLAAPGVDNAHGSWSSQWQLLDFFLVLIMTIAAWRLFGAGTGIIALLALTLSFHELDAPAWLWLNLLIAIALMRVAPVGKLRQLVSTYLGISALLLAVALVPFIAGQLRIAIYPQLEPQWSVGGFATPDFARQDAALQVPAEIRATSSALSKAADESSERLQLYEDAPATLAAEAEPPRRYSRYAPNAIVQAGPGVPSWQWNSYQLSWSGPVDADQAMRIMVLPRWAVTLLRFFEVAVLLLFAAVLAAEIVNRRWTLPGGFRIGRVSSASMIAAAVLALSITGGPTADAQTPDRELLRELEQRLLEPPDCSPRCAEIVAADVEVRSDSVSIVLDVHALEDVALPLPGSDRGWRPQAVLLNGSGAGQVLRGSDQNLWIRVTPGRHSVILRGGLPAADNVEIPFPSPPRVFEVDSEGWFVAGVRDRRLLASSLQLTRLQTEDGDESTARWESSRFPAFVSVTRNIEFDLDWRVRTTVQRIAPLQGALTLTLPLIDGESVLTEQLTTADGAVQVSMNPAQRKVSWVSRLPRSTSLQLVAGKAAPWVEVWRVSVGSIWNVAFTGVPESETNRPNHGARVAEFNPRGGEQLTMQVTRPGASGGNTLAFDKVDLSIAQGERSSTVGLALRYRSTRGAQHVLRLPEHAEVTEVRIDNQVQPLRADGRNLTLPILPGQHGISVKWRDNRNAEAVARTPDVGLGAPASNITLQLSMPENRWLVGTSGPPLGPAVLYWPELAVMILFALILGRVEWTPLRWWHWLLLGLGFSTFNWPVLGVVIVWLLASGARDRWRGNIPWWRYDATQVFHALFTLIALAAILVSLPSGLLGTPDMHVTGNGSYGNALTWFADRTDDLVPVATAWSVPMWTYKVLILAWALWLSFALLHWLRWAWQCFAKEGFWRSRRGNAIENPETPE
jgi:hypothetical protein